MKRKTVFLFGAGATLPWKSPTTSELTELVRQSGFKTFSGVYITEFIYLILLDNGYNQNDINYETIINVIEELIVYHSYFNNEKKTTSLLGCFFNPKFEEEIFNFSIKGGKQEHNYKLDIPKGVNYYFSKYSQHNETPKEFFLQHLIAELIVEINDRISKYAYHTSGRSIIDFDLTETSLFTKWMKGIELKSSLRIYTLNYDRLFKILLERSNISVFEGFNCGEYVPFGYPGLRANVLKILTDFDCNVHYNLHGSSFWEVEPLDKEQLPNSEIFLTAAPITIPNNDHAILQMEKGKTIMVNNIITGYQKAQKSLITPYKQMQAAFDRDCCFANEIYIVGYSLGDEHINESIKTAIRHNGNVKITLVDPFFLKNKLDFQMAIKLFPFRQSGYMNPTSMNNKVHKFFDGAFILYTMDFKEFLELENDPLHKFMFLSKWRPSLDN